MRASSADEGFAPSRRGGWLRAGSNINDDELVEVTPTMIRLRKRVLSANIRRKKALRGLEARGRGIRGEGCA
jgi:predicted membrane GTPase involved in stress response